MSTAMPVASATGCAVCLARICGLLTMRLIGKRASASGSLLACSIPSSDSCGVRALPWFAAERQRVPDE